MYLHTDTACYHHEYPDKLVDAQRDHWLPLIEWAQTTFKVPIHTTTGIVAPKQSPETVEAFRKVLEDMDNLSLAGTVFPIYLHHQTGARHFIHIL